MLSCPPHRRRSQVENSPVTILSEQKGLDLYFDTLDENGLDLISKHMRDEDYPSLTRVEDIMALFDVRSGLCNSVESIYRE